MKWPKYRHSHLDNTDGQQESHLDRTRRAYSCADSTRHELKKNVYANTEPNFSMGDTDQDNRQYQRYESCGPQCSPE